MAKYVAKEFSVLNARKFKDSVGSTQKDQVGNSTILYAVLGRNRAYTDEGNPDTPIETDKDKQYQLWRDAVGGRKITAGDFRLRTTDSEMTTARLWHSTRRSVSAATSWM